MGPAKAFRTWTWLWFIALTAIALVPILRVQVVPLTDYPGHLARLYALLHLDRFTGVYGATWYPYPNLAMDGFVLPLAHIMPIWTAGYIGVLVTPLLLMCSVIALQFALFGRVGATVLLGPLFIYNLAFIFGFLGYLLSLALALLGLAGWIASRKWHLLPRAVLFATVALVLYLGHLFAFGIYAVVTGVLALAECWRERQLAPLIAAAIPLAPASVLFLLGPTATQVHDITYGTWSNHFSGLLAPTEAYHSTIDRAAFFFALATLVLGLATRWISIAPIMRMPIAVLLCLALAMPEGLFGAMMVNIRLPIALAFLLIGSTIMTEASWKPALAIGVVVTMLLVAQVGKIDGYWRHVHRNQTELVLTLQRVLPQQARIFLVIEPLADHHNRSAQGDAESLTPYPHMADPLAITHGIYLPTVFSQVGKQPLHGVGPFSRFSQDDQPQLYPGDLIATLDDADTGCAVRPALQPYCGWQKFFDYVVLVDFGWRRPRLPDHLQPIVEGSFFVLYKVIGN